MAYRQRRGWFSGVNGARVKKASLWKRVRLNNSGDFGADRPVGIVFHYTVGCNTDISSALLSRGISVHFSVGRDGVIMQYVSVGKIAWHADNANRYYVGIEHAAYPSQCELTDKQLVASAKLVAALREYYFKKRGHAWPLLKIAGTALVPGFHDHRDGDGDLWNFNHHTDHLYHWSWDQYLNRIAAEQRS